MTELQEGYDPWSAKSARAGKRRTKAVDIEVDEHDASEVLPATGDDITSEAQTIAVGQLRAFIERIERLEGEKSEIADEIKGVYAELKGSGFDAKTVRAIIRLRKKEDHERQEEQAMLQLYMDALGMS
ncbi:uncharacterized protein (UPF0335 family) [Ochrobactrum anthropi]|nr:uncharacterized protein (UPF0335 family) [Brucella anthropi]